MKPLFSTFPKFLALALVLMVFSCNVYQKTPVSLDSALQTKKHVKVATDDNREYEFRHLERSNDKLLGVTTKNSTTVKRFKTEPVERDGKIRKYELDEERIESVYYRNEFQTKLVKIGFPVFLFSLLTYDFFLFLF